MTRAEAYELAKSRGFDKSVAVFGAKFTSDPDAVVCGIKREGRGVYVDVLQSPSPTVAEVPKSGEKPNFEAQSEELVPETLPVESPPVEESSEALTVESSPVEKPPETLTVELPPVEESSETVIVESSPVDKPAEATTGETSSQPSEELVEKTKGEEKDETKTQEEKPAEKPPRVKRKIYTANGSHQAICRFQGILMPKPEGEKGFRLLLPGLEVDATFAFPKTAWYYRKNPQAFEGVRNYIGYPRLTKEGKIVKVFIVSVDMVQNFQREQWEFVGMWCGPQKALFIQRRADMFPDEPRPHYYKYRFKNQDEYKKYLWDRYAYQVIAKREGDELLIVRNNPFACPRRKPEPPTRGGKPPGKFDKGSGDGKFNKPQGDDKFVKKIVSKPPVDN